MIGPQHLFFYGVLLGEVASARIAALLAGLGPGRRATAQGQLFAVADPRGWYPVLLASEARGASEVHGMVHEAGAVDLAALDRFEGVDPHDQRAGEYRREPIRVTSVGGEPLLADAYLYNHTPAAELEPIPHGDFTRWLQEAGAAPFAG